MIPRQRSGHPLRHAFTRAVPTSQCMTCHMHPGTNMVTPYQGLMWWDNETDGDRMYPARPMERSGAERVEIETRNPEGSTVRGSWGDRNFLARTGDPRGPFNNTLRQTRFADFHGHGWLFRAVWKRDRKGSLLDYAGNIVKEPTPEQLTDAVNFAGTRSWNRRPADPRAREAERRQRAGLPVHLKDIHLERGMHCVDCHFRQDNHGDGRLYGDPRGAIEIACIDCHGTVDKYATVVTSGPGARKLAGTVAGTTQTGRDLLAGSEVARTPFGTDRFVQEGGAIYQRSMVTRGLEWQVPQLKDSVDPDSPGFNAKAMAAKLVRRHGLEPSSIQGVRPEDNPDLRAHTESKMTCQTCHSSWITSCFGCHLSQTANQKRPMLHNEGTVTRNWMSYNFQVLRDDVYMLGKDGTTAGGRISPVRSSSAVVVSSQDINRQWIYYRQPNNSALEF